MFKMYILVIVVAFGLCSRAQATLTETEVICDTARIVNDSELACNETLACPGGLDKLFCRNKKLKAFTCDLGIHLTLHELCFTNVSCPNNLRTFVCETRPLIQGGNKMEAIVTNTKGLTVMAQFNKSQLCTNESSPDPPSDCPYELLANRTLVLYPNKSQTFNYITWMIKDMEEFIKQGPSQFKSSRAFSHEIPLERANLTIYTLSHPNHYVELQTTNALADFDVNHCSEGIDKDICLALPALKERLLAHRSSSSDIHMMSRLSLVVSLVPFLFFFNMFQV